VREISADEIKERFEKLIEKHLQLKREKRRLEELSEANVRKDFIDPLFEALGWNVRDAREYDAEKYVRGSGFADVAIKLNERAVILIEVKRFGGVPSKSERSVQTTLQGFKILADWTEEERQVLNYAGMTVGVKWTVLTNFEKFRLFNARTGDTVLNIEKPDGYIERINDLTLLIKRNVVNGNIDKLETRIERPDIDLAFLNLLNDWRLKLARNIKEKKPDLSLSETKKYVQRILDRLIIIRYAEDKWVLEDPDQLKAAYEFWLKTRTYTELTEVLKGLFVGFDQIHDSKIFEKNERLDEILGMIDYDVLGEIIKQLYNQSFRKFTSDILGNTYESYLGHELYSKENDELGLRQNTQLRKAGGIYFTPAYVVEFIVEKTLGSKLREIWEQTETFFHAKKYVEAASRFADISEIKLLDPACGSGSFLIRAFNAIKRYYDIYNEKIDEINETITREVVSLRRNGKGKEAWVLEGKRPQKFENYDIKILTENVYGVDLDPQATEIASVNLMLQALKKGQKMPLILEETNKIGNSLISETKDESTEFFEEIEEKRPFIWEEQFSNVFKNGGFDVVIMNPPWGAEVTEEEKRYFRSRYSDVTAGVIDSYKLFVKRALDLLKKGGLLGFIVPNTLLTQMKYRDLRSLILRESKIRFVVDLGEGVFGMEAVNPCCIVVIEKNRDNSDSKLQGLDLRLVEENEKKAEILQNSETQWVNIPQRYYEDTPFNNLYLDYGKPEWKLKEKLKELSPKLDEIVTYMMQGIKTGCNRVFLLRKKLGELSVPIVKGRDINRYSLKYANRFLLYVTDVELENHPEVKFYLEKQYQSSLRPKADRRLKKLWSRRPVQKGLIKWHQISEPRKIELFETLKIVMRQTADSIIATIDDRNFYNTNDVYNVVLSRDSGLDIRYVLGLLNSRLLNWYYRNLVRESGRTFAEVKRGNLGQLPIRKISFSNPNERENYDGIVQLVDEILVLKKRMNDIDTNFNKYVNSIPRIEDTIFKHYYTRYGKDVVPLIDSKIRGTIRRFRVDRQNDWLVLKMDFHTKTKEEGEEFADIEVLKCQIQDKYLRDFLFFSLSNCKKNLGSGNILLKTQLIPVPRFDRNEEKNRKLIVELIDAYSRVVRERSMREREIHEIDEHIDQKVYDLYGLNKEEILLVEGS
jgi:type I restriction-modification system DNA methylase subunit